MLINNFVGCGTLWRNSQPTNRVFCVSCYFAQILMRCTIHRNSTHLSITTRTSNVRRTSHCCANEQLLNVLYINDFHNFIVQFSASYNILRNRLQFGMLITKLSFITFFEDFSDTKIMRYNSWSYDFVRHQYYLIPNLCNVKS